MKLNKTYECIAITQILILVIGVLAFSYFVGEEFRLVSAVEPVVVASSELLPGVNKVITWFFKDVLKITPVLKTAAETGANVVAPAITFGQILNIATWIITIGALVVAGIAWAVTGDINNDWTFWSLATAETVGATALTYSVTTAVTTSLGWVPIIGWGITFIVGAYTLYTSTRRIGQINAVFNCETWQAKTGGADCEKCNDKQFPCTLYQCKSLGQACELVNPGDSARCVHKDVKDVKEPTIKARSDSLLNTKYSYVELKVGSDIVGAKIKYTPAGGVAGCLPSFQPFTFGIELDKTANCKFDNHLTNSLGEMEFPFGDGLARKNHTQILIFPNQEAQQENAVELPSGGNYEYYVRCESVNGRANVKEFKFEFCIDPLPDVTQPDMLGFNLRDKTPIKWFDEDENHKTAIKLYTNEPSKCKWSYSDKDYASMENILTCPLDAGSFNSQLSYTCSGDLTGLQNEIENKFYFRCNDTVGNENTFSKELTLVGSRPLVMTVTKPQEDEVIKGSSDSVKVNFSVETSAGLNNGIADCYYSSTGTDGTYSRFDDTRSYTHSTAVYLASGQKKYYIRCFDMAGNYQEQEISFKVEQDSVAPVVTRMYNEGEELKIATNEPANCVYDFISCNYNFEDGISMTTTDNTNHYAEWNTEAQFFIKCKDLYGNYPAPNTKCSVIAHPFTSIN
jgi:hypothetical protein